MTVPLNELRARRQAYKAKMETDSVAIFAAGHEVTRSRDTEYPFRQDSNFYYLTGITEPEAVLVLAPGQEPDEYLFVLASDAEQEIWHGRRLGTEEASQRSGVEVCQTLNELDKTVVPLLGSHPGVYWQQNASAWFSQQQQRWLQQIRNSRNRKLKVPVTQHDSTVLVDELRLIKDRHEQSTMRKSASIAVKAHQRAMKFVKPGRYEYQVAAELHHEFAMNGALNPAYGTICAGGDNACILHYTENSQQLKEGDLILIDAGCEYHGYASDISRTFPVSGRFSPAQKRLYNWVLKAQRAALGVIKPGATMPEAYKVAASVLTEALIDIGLLHGSLKDNLKAMNYRPYFMHGLGHWLGLDVHDVGEYQVHGEASKLKPGMVLTVEPGLYIPADAECPAEFRGLGIRIEDDILVTDSGHENLTAELAVTTDEIEALMNES